MSGDMRSERIPTGDKVTKDWLYTYRSREKKIELLRELIARISETSVEPKGTRYQELVTKSGLPSDLSDTVSKLEWLNDHYRKELRELVTMQVKVEEWIEKLEPRDKELVRVRFLLGNSIMKTCDILGVSNNYIVRKEKKLFG